MADCEYCTSAQCNKSIERLYKVVFAVDYRLDTELLDRRIYYCPETGIWEGTALWNVGVGIGFCSLGSFGPPFIPVSIAQGYANQLCIAVPSTVHWLCIDCALTVHWLHQLCIDCALTVHWLHQLCVDCAMTVHWLCIDCINCAMTVQCCV